MAASIAVAIGVSSCALKPVDVPKQLRQKAATVAPPQTIQPAAARPSVQPSTQSLAPAVTQTQAVETTSNQTVPQQTKLVEVYPPRGKSVVAGERRAIASSRGDITLNFENADVRIVIETVLDDLLGVNYVIDPDIRGNITIRTARPINRAALLPTLQVILAANGATLLRVGSIFRVARIQVAATAAPLLGDSSAAGYGLSVLPLGFVAAPEMQKILQPILPPDSIVLADEVRNLLIIRGTAEERQTAAETVGVFDVDHLAGTAVLLESLERVDVATVIAELENIFGSTKGGPLSGVVRFIPIERLNAVLVLTQQPRYLDEARNWIARLDRSQNLTGRQLFVYYVQNGKAADLAKTLSSVFTGSERPVVASVSVAAASTASTAGTAQPASPAAVAASPAAASALRGAGVRIIADEVNNALLILADRAEYGQIQSALAKLDIVPLQVLIEATILEVTLTDVLRFGVQYFFNSGGLDLADGGKTILSTATAPIQSLLPGFSFTLTNGASPKFIIDTLSQVTEVNVLSSPSVLVLDNQSARLQVGDQVPVTSQAQQSALTGGASLVNTIEYRDTGVTLDVRPRVNASGLVTLEISQEISSVIATTTSTINSPTIQQRLISSTVAINNQETVVLGGLIRADNTEDKAGIPFLNDLPLIGSLFGSQSSTINRTELLVILTPRVVRNQLEARNLTRDMGRRFAAVLELMEIGIKQPRRFAPSSR